MPNWCLNLIRIEGEKVHLDALKSKILKRQDNSINFMEYLIGQGKIPKQYKNEGWPDNNDERFGTKWDIPFSEILLNIEEELISIECGSAWSPVIPFVSTLCKKYNVNAIIVYFESGEDFGGRAEIHSNGFEKISHYRYWEASYLFSNEAFWIEAEEYIEDFSSDDFDDFQQSVPSLSPEDKDKLEMLWTANKYNL